MYIFLLKFAVSSGPNKGAENQIIFLFIPFTHIYIYIHYIYLCVVQTEPISSADVISGIILSKESQSEGCPGRWK